MSGRVEPITGRCATLKQRQLVHSPFGLRMAQFLNRASSCMVGYPYFGITSGSRVIRS
jgi:hypothetical protein